MKATESALLRAIRLEAPKVGMTAFRNNTGVLRDAAGNYVRYGLIEGGSDIVGWVTRTGTNNMDELVPRAIFTAIECKLPGKKPTKEQAAFIAAVKAAGGIAGVVTSVDEFRALIAAG